MRRLLLLVWLLAVALPAKGHVPESAFSYRAKNNPIAITAAGQMTKFVVNPAPALSQVLVRTKPDGAQTLYVHGLGLLYEVATNGTTRSYHYDYLGSTVAITDDSGQVTDRVEYGPYAAVTYRVGNTDTPFLFNGRYGVMTDVNGLLHMRARYYSPYLCRFVSEDPMGFEGGMNFYAYADGNPINSLDPFGFGAAGEGQARSWLNYNTFADVIVPGQVAWNNAMASYQSGSDGWAALSAGQTLGEQILTAATLGQANNLRMANSAAAGWSAMFAVLPVVAFQGTITMGAKLLATPVMLQAIQGTAGMLVFCVALIILELRKVELGDYLPSLAWAPLIAWVWK